MSDFLLNTTTGDLDLSTGDIQILDGTAAIGQHIKVRLRFFIGEWDRDPALGFPWYQQALGVKVPDDNILRASLRKAILTTPGVTELQSLTFDFDSSNRTLNISLSALTSSGPLTFDERFVI